jgi:hypothetical protein
VTFDDENIMPGGLNPFSMMLPPQAERLLRKDLPKPVNADRINKSNYIATILKLNVGIEQLVNKVLAENNSARRRRESRSQRDGGEEGRQRRDGNGGNVQFCAPPLPSTDARLQQYKAYGILFSNNASVVVDPNMNSKIFDAAGALLQTNGSFGNY